MSSKKRESKVTAPGRPSFPAWVWALLVLLAGSGVILWRARHPASASQISIGRSPGASSFLPTIENKTPAPAPAPEGMVWVPGGEFSMGSDDPRESICGGPDAMGDARPIHRVYVDGFWMDKTDVTNGQFDKFAKATSYVTVAERVPTKEEFPDAPPENLVAGSTVFTPTAGPVPLNDHYQWWRYEKGASWRHPEGPESDLKDKE